MSRIYNPVPNKIEQAIFLKSIWITTTQIPDSISGVPYEGDRKSISL